MDSSTADELRKLSEDQRRAERQHMLQALLANGFKLTIHRESKELSVYALVVSKDSPKFQEAKPGDTYANGVKGPDGHSGAGMMLMGNGTLTGQGVPLTNLVRLLTRELGRTVIDKTGLTSKYDFTLKWTEERQAPMFKGAEGSPPGTGSAPAPESSGPSIFTAVQEQLGLNSNPKKAMSTFSSSITSRSLRRISSRKRVWIEYMTLRTWRKLDKRRKPLLTGVGLLAVAMLVVFGVLNGTQSQASRTQSTGAVALEYEVASIKPNRSGGDRQRILFPALRLCGPICPTTRTPETPKTGLKGNYDFKLQWTPDESEAFSGRARMHDNAPPPDFSWPSIFMAIQEQLGLKLDSQKGPEEVLMIDHVEKPSEN